MRNLVALRDSTSLGGGSAPIVAVDVNSGTGELLALDRYGVLRTYDLDSGSALSQEWELSSSAESGEDHTWFDVVALKANGRIVAISHAGLLVSISIDLSCGKWSEEIVVEGDVECGILDAAWSPDQSRFVLVTNNHTILCMNSEWDVLDEVPLVESPVPNSALKVSWRGDGEQFALQTVDNSTGAGSVRVYSNELELLSTGRNIADGAASVLKGVGHTVAFATNGVLIAFPQQRIKGKHQVAFIEKNGLRHGDFDLQLPGLPTGFDAWSVDKLAWDVTSSLLAVEVHASTSSSTPAASSSCSEAPSLVQIYYRANYHWYLKQQWSGNGLYLLRFDSEISGRCYMTESVASSVSQQQQQQHRVRTVDLGWEVVRNSTRDASVAVADGKSMLLTPLGYNTVPPPMSMYSATLPATHKHSSFWSPPAAEYNAAGSNDDYNYTSGLLVLCEEMGPKFHLYLTLLDDRGAPIDGKSLSFAVEDVWGAGVESGAVAGLTSGNISYRAALALPSPDYGNSHMVGLVLLGNRKDTGADVIHRGEVDVDTGKCVSVGKEDDAGGLMMSQSQKLIPGSSSSSSDGGSGTGALFALLSNTNSNCEIVTFKDLTSLEPVTPHMLSEECVDAAIVDVTLSKGGGETVGSAEDEGEREKKREQEEEEEHGSEVEVSDVVVQLCFGLSTQNRLYCGDMLITAGASSFAVNASLGVLLYITTGTAPHLHFISLQALAALNPDRDIDAEDGVYQMIEYAPPRPVERGAKLVVSVPGAPKVVVQQPRGNLEAFEPRPLVLSHARGLIDSEDAQYLKCLMLLRRQRIDLNFLVDYNPARFVHFAPSFMKECVGEGAHAKLADVLCLFISSLEDGKPATQKYPLPLILRLLGDFVATPKDSEEEEALKLREVEGLTTYLESEDGDGKVNVLCRVLRRCLEGLLADGHTDALRPILCTYAKQKPPMLEEALLVIRSATRSSGAVLSSTKTQGVIRYLAFLADGELIFNAALGICDFEMCRAIARQCQMDPKAYLPLLEGFESIDKLGGGGAESYEHWIMYVEVALHLKKPDLVLAHGIKALLLAGSSSSSSDNDAGSSSSILDPQAVSRHMLTAVKDAKLFASALEQLEQAKRDSSTAAAAGGAGSANMVGAVLASLLSEVRYAYSTHLQKQRNVNHSQVIALMLMVEPPRALEAIDVALNAGNWQQAFFISGRYCKDSRLVSNSAGGSNVPTPSELANKIITDFATGASVSSNVLDWGAPSEQEELSSSSSSSLSEAASKANKAVEVSQMILDYRSGDVEGAVSILLKCGELSHAAKMAARLGRLDLLTNDISRAARRTAYQLITSLKTYEGSLVELVQELDILWANPEERLKDVREKDEKLAKELEWLDAGGDADEYDPDAAAALDGDMDDDKSEFSMASMRSDISFVSGASSILSGITSSSSQSSRSSQVSKAGSATVSVLSEMKVSKSGGDGLGSAAGGGGGDEDGGTTSFSVKGLEHSLLSRGSGKDDPISHYRGPRGGNKDGKERKRKEFKIPNNGQPLTSKQLRKINRGLGIANHAHRDTLGLGKELKACAELWKYAHIAGLGKRCADLCNVLMLLGTDADTVLAARVQHSMDSYTDTVRRNPAKVAPSYPRKWLAGKQMSLIRRFQAQTQESDASAGMGKAAAAAAAPPSSLPSFWKVAADGIALWHSSLRLVVLNHLYHEGDSDEATDSKHVMDLGMAEDAGDY